MRTVTTSEARRAWGALLDDVHFRGERIGITRRGKVVVAIVSAADLEELERFDRLEDEIDIAALDAGDGTYQEVARVWSLVDGESPDEDGIGG